MTSDDDDDDHTGENRDEEGDDDTGVNGGEGADDHTAENRDEEGDELEQVTSDDDDDPDVDTVSVAQVMHSQTLRSFCGRQVKDSEASSILFEQNAIAALLHAHGHDMKVALDLDEHLVLTACTAEGGAIEYAWQPANEEEQAQIRDQERVCLSELVTMTDQRRQALTQTLSAETWQGQVQDMQKEVSPSTGGGYLGKFQRLRLPASSDGWAQSDTAPVMQCEKLRMLKARGQRIFAGTDADDGGLSVNTAVLLQGILNPPRKATATPEAGKEKPAEDEDTVETAGQAELQDDQEIPVEDDDTTETVEQAAERAEPEQEEDDDEDDEEEQTTQQKTKDEDEQTTQQKTKNELQTAMHALRQKATDLLSWDGLERHTKTLDELAITPGACVYVWWLQKNQRRTRSAKGDATGAPASRSRFARWRVGHVQSIDEKQRNLTCLLEGDIEPTALSREGDDTFRTGDGSRVQLVECAMDANPFHVVMDVSNQKLLRISLGKDKKTQWITVETNKGNAIHLTGIASKSPSPQNVLERACSDLAHVLAMGKTYQLLLEDELEAVQEVLDEQDSHVDWTPETLDKVKNKFIVNYSKPMFEEWEARSNVHFMQIVKKKAEEVKAAFKLLNGDTAAQDRYELAKGKMGPLSEIAQKWGYTGVMLKVQYNSFVQKLIERVREKLRRKNFTSTTNMVQIHWQPSVHVDGVPSFLFREHVLASDLANPKKYTPAPWLCPGHQRLQLHMGDCIATADDSVFATPRVVDLQQLLCVPGTEDKYITIQDAWHQESLATGQQVRFPLIYATRQRQVHMLPWLADETDIRLVDRLPGLVQKLLTVTANVFTASEQQEQTAPQDVVTGARNASTAADFVQYCVNLGIVKQTRESKKRDDYMINQNRQAEIDPSWEAARQLILAQFHADDSARLQRQFAVTTPVQYADEIVEYHPLFGIISALKPGLLQDFWEQYKLSDGYYDDDDDDDAAAVGAAYSIEAPLGEDADADEAAPQMHPLKQLRQQHTRDVKARQETGLKLSSAIANPQSAQKLPQPAERAVKQVARVKPGDVETAVKTACDHLVDLLSNPPDPAVFFENERDEGIFRREFSHAFVDAMHGIGARLSTAADSTPPATGAVTWSNQPVLTGLLQFAGPVCHTLFSRSQDLSQHDCLFKCLVSLCEDATRVLVGHEGEDSREIRCVWTLWQTCLNTLGSTFLREEPGDAFAQGLYHVYDGDYIEEFDRRGSEDLVPAMFAELQAVPVSTWTARADGSASQHVQAMLAVMAKIRHADRLHYPAWETPATAAASRFFFRDAPSTTMRLAWGDFLSASHAAARAFDQDVKLLQVRAEQQCFKGERDPRILAFDMNSQAQHMNIHPLLLVFANHVFQRQAVEKSAAVTDTYFITHENFDREPGARRYITECQALLTAEIKDAQQCFADNRRGAVQWVRSGDPVPFQSCLDDRTCKAALTESGGGVNLVTCDGDRKERETTLTFAGATTLTCLAVGVVASAQVLAAGDDSGKVHIRKTTPSDAVQTATFQVPGVTVIAGVSFSRDGSELAVLGSDGQQSWLVALSVHEEEPAPSAGGESTGQHPAGAGLVLAEKTRRAWREGAQGLSQRKVGANPSVFTPHDFRHDQFAEMDADIWTPVLLPLPQFWSNQSSATGRHMSQLRQRESVRAWQNALVRVIRQFVQVESTDPCSEVAQKIHLKTGYDLCMLHSATQMLQDDKDPRKHALHFYKSQCVGRCDDDVRGRTVLVGVVDEDGQGLQRSEHVFCISSAQDDYVPDVGLDEGEDDTGPGGGDEPRAVTGVSQEQGGTKKGKDSNDSSSGKGGGESADSGNDAAPDGKSLETQHEPRLEAFLNPRHLCLDRQTLADGNCQFDALARQIQQFSDDYPDRRHDDYIAVKSRVLQYLKTTPSYRDYIQDNEQGGYEKWLKKMSTPFAWGDFFTLQAAADTYRRPIHLYEYNNSLQSVTTTPIHPKENIQPTFTIPFQVAFVPELHYYSVQRLETAQSPPSAVLAFHPVQAHNTDYRLMDGGVHGPASTTSVKKTETKQETNDEMHIDRDSGPMSLSDMFPRRIAHVLPSAGLRWYPETPPARAPGGKLKISAEASTSPRYPETPPAHAPETFYVPVAPAGLFVPVQPGQPEAAAWGGYVSFRP